jgi:predicted RNase H-like nuclease (RuvC/YqgF family)
VNFAADFRLTGFVKLLPLIVAFVFLASSSGGFAQVDDLRVRQLENEVTRLQRELSAQSRRIDELERTVRNAPVAPRTPAATTPREDGSPAWLVSTNWDRLRPGMKEIDVVALLGRPTSVRTDADGKRHSLFYALELGPNAVLSGNVQFGAAGVTAINKPVLR